MHGFFTFLLVAVLALTIPYIGRVLVGPTIYDRVQGLNGFGSQVPMVLVLIGLLYERVEMFVDLALALILINLFTTLLIARYARRTHAEEEGE